MKKQFKCKPCNKTFPKQSQLTRHLNTIFHSGGLQVPCPHCPGKYSRKDIMLAHMRVKHPELINAESGQITPNNKKSSKVTMTKNAKKAPPPTSSSAKDKPFICTVCNQRFRLQNTLTCHMRRHTGERPYQCPHCTWTFTQSTPLKMHMLKIHGVEGYQVAKPGKRSRILPKVKKEAVIEGKDKVAPVMALRKRKGFQCQVCGLRVQNEIQLNEHLNSHKLKEEEEEPLENVWGVQVPLRDPLEVSMSEDQFEIEFASEYIDEGEEETEVIVGEIRGQFVSTPGQFEEPEVIQLDSDDEDEEEEEVGIKIERVSSCSSSFEGMPEVPPEILEIFDDDDEEEEMEEVKPVIFRKNEIRCNECGRTFGNHGALGVHCKKIHGRRSSSGGFLSVSR